MKRRASSPNKIGVSAIGRAIVLFLSLYVRMHAHMRVCNAFASKPVAKVMKKIEIYKFICKIPKIFFIFYLIGGLGGI